MMILRKIVVKNGYGRHIKTILGRTVVKNCSERDINLRGTVIQKCNFFWKSIASRASPSLILSRTHSSQYHFSHFLTHSSLCHHTPTATSTTPCNWLSRNLHHSSRATSRPPPHRKTVAAQPPSHQPRDPVLVAPHRKSASSRDIATFTLIPSCTAPKTRQFRDSALCNTTPTATSAPSRPPLEFLPPFPHQLSIFYLFIIFWINDGSRTIVINSWFITTPKLTTVLESSLNALFNCRKCCFL